MRVMRTIKTREKQLHQQRKWSQIQQEIKQEQKKGPHLEAYRKSIKPISKIPKRTGKGQKTTKVKANTTRTQKNAYYS